MKWAAIVYVVLLALGIVTVIAVPVAVSQSGSTAVPGWTAAISPGSLSKAHAFIGTDCESCHSPVRGVVASKCITCHAWAPELLMNPSTAFHATFGECRGCHVEHRGLLRRPITMDHQVLTKIAFGAAGHGGSLNCQSCHATQDKHQGFFGTQCASCHLTSSWNIATYLHPSPRSTDCNQCHKPPPSHNMMHFAMMDRSITGQRKATVDQCFRCHQTDSFNNIKGVGWVKMH